MSAISVFLKAENPELDVPRHSASKSLALLAVQNSAKWADAAMTKIQLLTGETWRQFKSRVRPSPSQRRRIPKLLPPRQPLSLDLSYPMRGQETLRHPHYALRYNL
jgi:hypothetical protein